MTLPAHEAQNEPVTAVLSAHWEYFARVLVQAEQHILTRLPAAAVRVGHGVIHPRRFLPRPPAPGEHLTAETHALFAAAEQFSTEDVPITAMLRQENAHLRELIMTFHRQRLAPDRNITALQHTGHTLLQVMQAHLREESAVLFSYLDARLSESEVEELRARPMLDHIYPCDPVVPRIPAHRLVRFRRPAELVSSEQ